MVVVLVGGAGESGASSHLPKCPTAPFSVWNNCWGSEKAGYASKYEGEWKNNKWHGYGTFTYYSGGQCTGDWRTANRGRSKFNSLSSCTRKYIQNFPKTAGLHNSSIDGQRGPGTASALNLPKNLGKLNGKSSAKTIQQLSQNPVCD